MIEQSRGRRPVLHLPYASAPLEHVRNPTAGAGSRYPSWPGPWSARWPAVPGTSGRPSAAAGKPGRRPPAWVTGNDGRTGDCSGRPVRTAAPRGHLGRADNHGGRQVRSRTAAATRSGCRSPPRSCSFAPEVRGVTAVPGPTAPSCRWATGRTGSAPPPGPDRGEARRTSPAGAAPITSAGQQPYWERTLRSWTKLHDMPPDGSRSGTRPGLPLLAGAPRRHEAPPTGAGRTAAGPRGTRGC